MIARPRWRLISAAIATIALTVTAMVAGPATAAVPGPPTSVTAHAGDQLAEVTWNAPTPDDPAITGYTVTASPADSPAVTVDPTARTATVTGLTNGTANTFTVAATNPDGTSPPSDPSAPVTPAHRPPPPSPWPPAQPGSSTAVPSRLSGRLQQTNTEAGIAGETLILERRPKGITSWSALATATTTSDGTLDPPGSHPPGPTPSTGHALLCRHNLLLTDDGCRRYDPTKERQATELAGELLIPTKTAINAAFANKTNAQVASHFEVSTQFAQMRMAGARKIAERAIHKRTGNIASS